MRLENIVIDARDPKRLGEFWRQALGARMLTHQDDLVEMRVEVDGGSWFDVCLPRVDDIDNTSPRLHLDLAGGERHQEVVARLLEIGAARLDIGQGDVPWVVLCDPESNPFCVMEFRPEYVHSGPIAGIPLDSADPEQDAAFWAALTGWERADGAVPSLRHPSGRGPLLELCPEIEPKRRKNHLHLDVRAPAGLTMGEAVAHALELGAYEVDHEWDVPWTILADPSGNEFCILPSSTEGSPQV